jgi:chromosome partitioning protein
VRTIAIINQKGGCGKTTTAINLAGTLASRGSRTLLVDMDPQSHCAAGLAIPEKRIDLDVGDAMVWPDEKPLDRSRLVWRTSRNLDLIPSRMKLAGLEAGRGGLADREDRDRRLRRVIRALADDYDLCLIDCSPAIGLLTYNALVAADEVLIPVDTSFFSLQSATKQVNTIRTVGRRLGVAPPHWLVATIHDPDSALAKDLLAELRDRFGRRLAPAVIRRDQSLKEVASFGQPVIEYSPRSPGAADYGALADWLREVRPTSRARDEESDEGPEITISLGASAFGRPEAGGVSSVGDGSGDGASWPGATAEPVGAGVGTARASRTDDLARLARDLRLARTLTQRPATDAPTPERALVEVEPIAAPAPIFGPRVAGGRVSFVQPLFLGRRVAIAGAFNGWSADAHVMRRDEDRGIFEVSMDLPPGRHAYRLVIDGRWTADPFNSRFELNPFGEPNSVIDVPG